MEGHGTLNRATLTEREAGESRTGVSCSAVRRGVVEPQCREWWSSNTQRSGGATAQTLVERQYRQW